MFLHVGNNINIKTKNIIGVFDMDTATVSPITKDFLKKNDKNGNTLLVAEDLPKSFTLTDDGKIYMSQISASSLKGRL